MYSKYKYKRSGIQNKNVCLYMPVRLLEFRSTAVRAWCEIRQPHVFRFLIISWVLFTSSTLPSYNYVWASLHSIYVVMHYSWNLRFLQECCWGFEFSRCHSFCRGVKACGRVEGLCLHLQVHVDQDIFNIRSKTLWNCYVIRRLSFTCMSYKEINFVMIVE